MEWTYSLPVPALLTVMLRTVNLLPRLTRESGSPMASLHSLLVADPHAEFASVEYEICSGVSEDLSCRPEARARTYHP